MVDSAAGPGAGGRWGLFFGPGGADLTVDLPKCDVYFVDDHMLNRCRRFPSCQKQPMNKELV